MAQTFPFMRAVCKRLGLGSVSQAQTGALAAIQRTDSALGLNVHVDVLALDGVYVKERANAQLTFPRCRPRALHKWPTPSAARQRALARIFKAPGSPEPLGVKPEPSEPDPEPLSLEQPALFACAMHTPRARTPSPEPDEPVAEALGVNVHAKQRKQRVDGRNKKARTTRVLHHSVHL